MAYHNSKDRKDWLMRAMPLGVGDLSQPLAVGLARGRSRQLKAPHAKNHTTQVGRLTQSKRDALKDLAQRVLGLMRRMAQTTFVHEPLDPAFAGKLYGQMLEQRLVAMQQGEAGLNACWAEQARMRVAPAMEHSNKHYLAQLAGRLRFCGQKIPVAPAPDHQHSNKKQSKKKAVNRLALPALVGPPKPVLKYFHVPLALQSRVTDQELQDLQGMTEAGGALAVFRRVILEGDTAGLSQAQAGVVRHIHGAAQTGHRCPDFGAKDRFTLQLHLDYRMLPTVKRQAPRPVKLAKALKLFDILSPTQPPTPTPVPAREALLDVPSEAKMLRSGETWLLEDEGNRCYRRFLSISGVQAGGPRIPIPVVLSRSMARRMAGTEANWASLIVELTSDGRLGFCAHAGFAVGVRLVVAKKPVLAAIDLSQVTVTLGRDFGYANTVCLSVVRSGQPVDLTLEATGAIRAQSQEDAKAFFEGHVCQPDVQTLHQARFSGQRFLSRINQHCARIDALTSRISLAYQAFDALRARTLVALGLSPDAGQTWQDVQILPEHKKSREPGAGALARAFFEQLGQIGDLKKARRNGYKKIAACKKNWFGYLTSIEVKLAQTYGAVIVREDLTVEAIEKESPQYKGRLFNKMINRGSKGQYQKMGSQKFQWNGIPETIIGSWYTSRACTVHARIAQKKSRQGEQLHLPCCGGQVHADEHASQTIARYHFLRPIDKSACGAFDGVPAGS